MDLKNKVCLVTGGAGFIGSHVADLLLSEKAEKVIILDDFSASREENIKHLSKLNNVNIIHGDLRDHKLVESIIEDNGVDIIHHIGALAGNLRSNERPRLGMEINIDATLNILEVSLHSDVKRIICSSSSAVYGNSRHLPLHEDLPTDPVTPYGVSKLAQEKYCMAFYRLYGLKTTCLRYFNVYGPREYASPYTGVVARFIEKILKNEEPIITGTGEETRDYTYVTNVASAHILTTNTMKSIGEFFNIGSGIETTATTLANLLIELTGNEGKLKPVYKKARKADVIRRYSSIEKAENLIGYKPTITLRDGLLRTIEWYKEVI